MSAYAFGLLTPRDMLEKARREVVRLANAESQEPPSAYELSDSAINAAWTLWHLCDWIAHSTDQTCIAAIERLRVEMNSPRAPTNRLGILQDYIRADSHMALCNALANGAKHFTLYEPPEFDVSRIVATEPGHTAPPGGIYAGTASVELSSGVSLSGSVSNAKLPRYVAKLRLDGLGIPALDIFRSALGYWDSFFEANRL